MRGIISILLIVVGTVQFLYFEFSMLTLLIMVVLNFTGGFLSDGRQTLSQRDSDNLNTLATIERNRYFRKQD